MRKFRNLTGQRFGRILVESLSENKKHGNRIVWNCLCDCGTKWEVLASSLMSGNTRSCGCLHKDHISKQYGESSKNALYNQYKRSAKLRKLEFNLTKEEFIELTSSNCHYCGVCPTQISKPTRHDNGHYKYNGIDRVSNSDGYFLENCVPCCKICNRAKLNMNYDEFVNWIANLTAFKNNKIKIVGYIGATMDLPHRGHINLINRAKKQCDYLIISLNTDEFVEQFKGKKPIMSLEERISVIENLKSVDKVIINTGGADSKPAILSCKPQKIFVGNDYNLETYCKQMNFTPEWLLDNGIEIIFLPRTEGISTTEIKERVKNA